MSRITHGNAIRMVAGESGLTLRQSKAALSALSRVLRYAVLRDLHDLVIKDIGTFYLGRHKSRKITAPITGSVPLNAKRKTIKLPATFNVRLRTARALRRR